jgi:hypothetical protein
MVSVAGNKSRTFTVSTSSTSSTWTQFSMLFGAVDNAEVMNFIPVLGGPAYIGLDNVSVEDTGVLVPEPKSCSLLIAGLVMIAARFGHR